MSRFSLFDGVRTLTAWSNPQGRRVYLEMGDEEGALDMALNPSQAHDLIAALRHVAQQRIPDDTEDGAA
jgi:hypothetical protein